MTLRFEELPARELADLPIEPYDKWRTLDGDVAAQFYRTSAGYLLRFAESADFTIDFVRQVVTCSPAPDMPDEHIADLYFNQVLPLLMGHDGDPVIHASGVAIDGIAVGFIGPTGRGKSTLAASFARAGHLCLDQSEPWPIHFSQIVPWPERRAEVAASASAAIPEQANLQFRAVAMDPGDAILFSGSSQWHYRDPLPDDGRKHFCDLLFLHFIPRGAGDLILPVNWALLFGIPELAELPGLAEAA